jgi:hypothetical protein
LLSDAKRNDAHDCFNRVNIRYKLPEVLTASGIKLPGLTDRLIQNFIRCPSLLGEGGRRPDEATELENLLWLNMPASGKTV